VNKTLAELSQQLFPPGLELRYVEVDELREQPIGPATVRAPPSTGSLPIATRSHHR